MDNNYKLETVTNENKYLKEMLGDCIKTTYAANKEWQKTIKFIVIVMSFAMLLTVTISLGVFFKYYFTTNYTDEIQAANTTTNINTNTNNNEE